MQTVLVFSFIVCAFGLLYLYVSKRNSPKATNDAPLSVLFPAPEPFQKPRTRHEPPRARDPCRPLPQPRAPERPRIRDPT